MACLDVQTRDQMSCTGGFFTLWMKKKEKEGVGVVWMVVWSSQDSEQKCNNMQLWMQRIMQIIPVKCQTSALAYNTSATTTKMVVPSY